MKTPLCCLQLSLLGLILNTGVAKGANDRSVTFGGKYYKFGELPKVSWFSAWLNCQANSLKLVAITSQAEDDFLTAHIAADPTYNINERFWTSGLNAQNNHVFWLDQVDHSTYVNWKAEEPDKGFPFCVYFTSAGLFGDDSCDTHSHYICEGQLAETPNVLTIPPDILM